MADMLFRRDADEELIYGIRGHIVLKPGRRTQVGKKVIAYPVDRRDPDHGYRVYGFIAAGVMWSVFVTAPCDGKGQISHFALMELLNFGRRQRHLICRSPEPYHYDVGTRV